MKERRWMGIVLIIAGMYFGATGLSGAVLPLYAGEVVSGLVIFTGIIGILGIAMIIIGGILFMKK